MTKEEVTLIRNALRYSSTFAYTLLKHRRRLSQVKEISLDSMIDNAILFETANRFFAKAAYECFTFQWLLVEDAMQTVN